MNPNAKISDEQFEAYLKQIRELAEGPVSYTHLTLPTNSRV